MSNLALDTIARIRAELEKGKRTVTDIAGATGMHKHAITACLLGMHSRREASRSRAQAGRECRWWMV